MNALVLVDLQYDFMPGGALAVRRGDETVVVANRVMPAFDDVVATQDWHPADHGSFAVNHPGTAPYQTIDLFGLPQVLWPAHCVQGTHGAELHAALDRSRISHVVRKGTDPTVDSYSGFFDNGKRKATGLATWLRGRGIDKLTILGLATDYCVKFTALDARALGFHVELVADGCRAVELEPGDGERAISEMRAAGVQVVDSAAIVAAASAARTAAASRRAP
jgi:nicotinamidase/pyrazinamidase